MPKVIPWHTTIGAKLGASVVIVLLVLLALIVTNWTFYQSRQGLREWSKHMSKGRRAAYRILYLANQLFLVQGELRTQTADDLREEIKGMEDRLRDGRTGNASLGIPPVTDTNLLGQLEQRSEDLKNKIKPALLKVLSAPSRDVVESELASLDQILRDYSDDVNRSLETADDIVGEQVRHEGLLQFVLGLIAVAALGGVLVITWNISSRIRMLAESADRIAGGDLSHRTATRGRDEVAALAESFTSMTGQLSSTIDSERQRRVKIEALLANIRTAVTQLTSTSAEILASTTQQASGAQEQAAAVSQTVTTVDEVTQTAEQAAQRAKNLGEAVHRTQEIGKTGRRVVDESIVALTTVQGQIEATAENILGLAERAQAISEIIAAVNDIAEQTNLLALNAAIEASRAGEHGKGFTVVANEVKVLADQSKKATGEVRQILGEIQKATNTAVLSTEEVTKGVTSAAKVAGQAGETIKTLADALAEAAQVAAQIVGSAGQQATGMAQIHQAMKNVDLVAKQNLAAMKQNEQAAQNLNAVGSQLAALSAE